jgi:spore cortex formation protein SpoVR/YcgB (stage V sporulation)
MKIGNLFDLLTDARDILEFFEECHNREQLVSRLERLKRQGSEELMECIDGLRVSVDRTFEDTLEMSASLDEKEEEEIAGDEAVDKELEDLVKNLDAPVTEPNANDQNPEPEVPAVDLKNDTTSST